VKSSKVKIMLVGLTALCLSAGVVAGMLVSRLPAAGAAPDISAPPQPGLLTSSLAEKLSLNPDQQAKMRTIWEGVRTQVQTSYRDASDLEKQRDNDIAAMLTDEQKAKFEKIAHKYHDEYLQISRTRDQTIQQAIAHTKELLNPDQQKKYDEELKLRIGHMPPAAS